MIFTLLLTIGLDMSLPEFQPEKDISGNYIMGSYDVSSDDFEVEELEDVPEEVAPSVDDSLSSSPVRSEQLSVSGNDDVVSAIQSLQEDNNSYWELFLDSYPIEVHHTGRSSFTYHLWKFTSSGGLSTNVSNNDKLAYFPVLQGIEYHVYSVSTVYSNTYRVGVVNSIDDPTSVTNFTTFDSSSNIDFNITPSQSGYLVFHCNTSFNVSFSVEWDTIEQESYTLSELGNAVMQIDNSVSRMFNTIRAILLFVLFVFAYPIVISIVKNIVGGDK